MGGDKNAIAFLRRGYPPALDTTDARLILQKAVGKIETFPAEK